MENSKKYCRMTESEAENYLAKGEDEIAKEIKKTLLHSSGFLDDQKCRSISDIRKTEAAETRYMLRRQMKEFKDLSSLVA